MTRRRAGAARRRMRTAVTAAIVTIAAVASVSPLPAREQEPAVRSVAEGVYTEAQARRGQEAYADRCASCHGPLLEGKSAPPLTGDEFMAKWSGRTLRDLFVQIRATMPQEGAGTLSRQMVADMLAYKLSVEGFPPGTAELGTNPDVLKQFLIERSRLAPPKWEWCRW
jgi:mono/diheme cytochrome c family protein